MRDSFKFARIENIRRLTEQLHAERDPAKRARLERILEDIKAGNYEPPDGSAPDLTDPEHRSDR